ncbi:MAG: hypothetical protein U0790_08285 [Isosphaeraceae bacterium]
MIGLSSLRRARSHADVPPDRSEYLRGVTEPITMVFGISWDDGGSNGLSFKDARGTEYSICMMDSLDGDQHLRFGSTIPEKGRPVSIGSEEERAILGLLQRWSSQSRDAQAWMAKIEEWRETNKVDRVSIFNGDESDHQRGNLFAVSIMERLERRN